MMTFMGSAVNIALPTVGNELALDAIFLSWVTTSTLLASAMFIVPFGKISDIYGRKRLYKVGIFCFTIASLLVVLYGTALTLMVARILQGIASAMVFGTSMAILTSVFPIKDRGKVLGINITAVHTGVSIGPYLGGFLIEKFGWQSIFLVNIPMGSIVLVLIFWKLKGEWADAQDEKFDKLGAIIYGLTLFAIIYGFSILPALSGIIILLLATIGLLIFIKWESIVENPVLDMMLFRKNKVFALANITVILKFIATYGSTFLLTFYLQYIKGLSPQNAGLVLLAQPVLHASFSTLAGRLSDRVEPFKVVTVGMTIQAIGLALFVLLTEASSLGLIIIGLALLGLGSAFFSSPTSNAIMTSVEPRLYGVASGMRSNTRLIGQMLNMTITMILFNIYLGRSQITPDLYPLFSDIMHVAFIIFAVICFGGIFTSIAGSRVNKQIVIPLT